MQTVYQILAMIGAGLLIWYLYHMIKSRPDQFSRANLSKSLGSIGILAILLIAFVTFLVWVTRHT